MMIMSDHEKLEQARRKMIRYRILKILDAGRPYPVGEGLIELVMIDADLNASKMESRKALQYLCDKKYVDLETKEVWEARLLPYGVDYLENPDIDDVGIARPTSI